MLGLGTSVTSVDSGQIYKELSELVNYADLDIHFDFSTLTGDHGDGVDTVANLGVTAVTNRIDSANGAPTLNRTSLSRACVDFPNSGDNDNILDMAADYTTTGKAMTFFIVFQWDAASAQTFIANADDSDDDYLNLTTGGRLTWKMAGGSSSGVVTSNTNGGSISYTPALNTPTVYLIQRTVSGDCNFYADNNLLIAVLGDTGDANFTLGAIGGTTAGTTDDFNGKVCEVGLYDTDIGDDNLPILLESLCTKWGIDRRE